MSNVQVKIDYHAVGQLLKSEPVKVLNEELASAIVNRCGEGYAYSSHNTGQRIITNVYPNSKEAAHDNYQNNTLLRNMK